MNDRGRALVATLALVFATSLFSFYAGASGLFPLLNQSLVGLVGRGGPAPSISNDMGKLHEVQKHVQRYFVDQVEDEALLAGALKGMVQATGDRYSTYLTAAEYARMLESFQESFTGIGVRVEISAETNLVTVVSPIKGTPGERAGLRAGDAIVEVDGKDVTGLTLDETVNLIRGREGTSVRLKVKRPDVDKLLDFTIERAIIQHPTIEHAMVSEEQGIGYIKLLEFNTNVGKRLQSAIDDLRSKGMDQGLILDLRQNPGGLLSEAVEVASVFLKAKEPVVHITYKSGNRETHEAHGKGPLGLKLVVLIDKGSASAAEIVAGAIKDLGHGVLVGEKSFGKGSVQQFFDMTDGGGLKLTTARYLTAGGHLIHEKGIEPDVLEPMSDPKIMPGDPGDNQLARAIEVLKSMR